MSDAKLPGSSYVQKVRDDTQRYIRSLLTEIDRVGALAETASAELRIAAEENTHLEERLREQEEELAQFRAERAKLQSRLSASEEEREQFLHDFVDLERRNNDLANLYVATYRLHGTLDEQEVVTAIEEIVINLIGCEQFGLFDVDESGASMHLLREFGLPSHVGRTIPISGGLIGRAMATGDVALRADAPQADLSELERGLTACVPLKVGTRVSGALLLFELLPQKRGRLEPVDGELLELLAAQAGPAVYASRLVPHPAGGS
jgi:GAF domain